ncbi:UbiA family prenyltransferase [Candidatus Micrarchaeota archaeon]|nr:UbiA family prenyltransferase [Candidatus Micrarchaeota archaeon]
MKTYYDLMKAYYDLIRFDHAIMIAVAVLISESITLGHFPELSNLLYASLIIPMLIEIGSFALNDYLDINIDKANKRTDRPLVRGDIDEHSVIRIIFFSYLIAVILSVFLLPVIPMAIAVVFAFLSIIYDAKIKHYPLVGNLYIGLAMGIPFLFGNYIFSTSINLANIILFILGLFIGTAREIIKDVQDIDGDKKAGARTLPILIGIDMSLIIAIVLIILFIPLSVYMLINLFKPGLVALIVLIIAEFLAISTIYVSYKRDYSKARKLSLIMMIVGLISIFLSVFGY